MRASDILSSIWHIVREDDLGHCIILLDDKYHVVYVSRNYQFESCLPSDGGPWCAPFTDSGLRYVSNARSLSAAMSQWRRHIAPLSKED